MTTANTELCSTTTTPTNPATIDCGSFVLTPHSSAVQEYAILTVDNQPELFIIFRNNKIIYNFATTDAFLQEWTKPDAKLGKLFRQLNNK